MSTVFNLREARMNAGLSQRELAGKTGAPVATVQGLEAGRGARPSHAKLIADFFGVTVTDLMPSDHHESRRSAA